MSVTIEGRNSVVWLRDGRCPRCNKSPGQLQPHRLTEWWVVACLLGALTGKPAGQWAESVWAEVGGGTT